MYFNIIENEIIASFDGQKILETLKRLQRNTNWEVVEERRKFIRQFCPLIVQWNGQSPPNVQEVFRSDDVEHLAMDYINLKEENECMRGLEVFIDFMAYSGYKDEPKLDVDGKPSSRRTTPVHHASKQDSHIMIDTICQLFKIYNRYDVNYTDESGLSHFHVACMYGYDDEIEKFLELGQDPNCLWTETGDSPLHLYLIGKNEYLRYTEMAEPLMRKSANLNLANKNGLTPLHIISKRYTFHPVDRFTPQVSKLFFDISDELNQPLQIDARDKFGNTPLHLAVLHYNDYVTEMLLRRGADPNSANDEGSTPLHLFYKRDTYIYDVKGSVELFFRTCDEVNHSVQVDARDKLGRIPLQLAVANLWPQCIDILFERGADLSNFIFPTESYFADRYKSSLFPIKFDNCRLRLASGALAVVEKIENRGYQLKRSDALTIMKFFAEYELFEKSSDLGKSWYDDEEFMRIAKEMWICPGLSRIPNLFIDTDENMASPSLRFDEVIRLRPEDAAKLLTYEDYWKLACSDDLIDFSYRFEEEHALLCALNLCEKLSRGFFRSWALDPFIELIYMTDCRFSAVR